MQIWRIFIIQFAGVLFELTSSTFVCPDSCECVAVTETVINTVQDIKVSCDWPAIPDERRLRSLLPNGQSVTRLTINCKHSTSSTSTTFRQQLFASLFPRLRHLSVINCRTDDLTLPAGVFDDVSTLKTLHLENLHASSGSGRLIVDTGALNKLASLEKLTITASGLLKLPKSELCSLKELKSLNLSDNRLTSLDDIGVDACTNQVVLLDLDKNGITKMDSRFFDNFTSLRILRLNENQIQQIQRATFKSAKQLRHLHMSNNKMTNVDDLPVNLHTLDLSLNNLHIIPPSVAVHSNMQHLNLSHNFVDVNSPFTFESTSQLTTLDMSHNKLYSIPLNFFSVNSSSIIDLLLNNNDIAILHANCLKNLTNLRRLNLANNKLSTLDRRAFDGVSRMEELFIDGNAVSKFDDDFFSSISHLTKLGMSRNIFIDLPKSLVVLKHLRSLDISLNRISTINEYLLVHLINLTHLNLSDNKLTSIERNQFEKMSKLQTLDLSDNAVERLATNSFDGANALRELQLQNNLVRDVAGVFANLQRLNFLNLSNNRLKHLDLALLPQSLNVLLAANNSINRMTNFLPTLRVVDLRFVDFSSNKLEKLTSSMLPSSLEAANFSGNEISRIESDALNDKANLTLLDLSFNKLSKLNQTSITVSTTIAAARNRFVIYLRGNPFECTCDMHWLKSTYVSGGVEALHVGLPSIGDFDKIKCTTLRDSDERSIGNVSTSDFQCQYSTTCAEGCNCCEFEFCDCKNSCPVGCSCYIDASSTYNEVVCTNVEMNDAQLRSIPMSATTVRLDGSRLTHLTRNAFFGRNRLKRLFLNNSFIETMSVKAFNGLSSLELLDLSDNRLAALTGDEFHNMPKLESLQLNGNKLNELEWSSFDNLPNLKQLTLNNNRLKTLPRLLSTSDSKLQSLTLSNNPWKCDCFDRYQLQTWLPMHVHLVSDNRAIYCFENLTDSRTNSSSTQKTILAVLPPTGNTDVVKVNFWTFVNEINATFCYPKTKEYELDGGQPTSSSATLTDNTLLFISVAFSACLLCAMVALIVWRLKSRFGKRIYDKYSSDSTVVSSLRTSPTTPTPLIQYDAFVSYSKLDEDFVESEIVPRLEHVHPYYKLCLLHREFPSPQDQCVVDMDRQVVNDDLINAMMKSQRVITVLSSNFIENEWKQLHVRTAYQCLSRCTPRKQSATILLEDSPYSKNCKVLLEKEPLLAHYIRMSEHYPWNDKLFWEKLLTTMPDEPSNNDCYASSSHYSDLYCATTPTTTIVQSQLI